jgi:hypothetical protein
MPANYVLQPTARLRACRSSMSCRARRLNTVVGRPGGGIRALMRQRRRQIGYDWVLNSHMSEIALAKWIHVLAGKVWHGRK